MADSSRSRCNGQEFVTDWRMVYAAVGVVTIMVTGGFVWSQYGPVKVIAPPTSGPGLPAVDTASVVHAESSVVEVEAMEIVLPWAPLAPEQQLPPESTRPSPRDEPESPAIPKPDNRVLAASDEAVQETDARASSEQSWGADQFAAELERAITLDFNPIKATPTRTPTSIPNRRRTVAQRPSEPLTQAQQFAQLANPADLAGLPILGEEQCHKSVEEVKELARVSQGMARTNRTRIADQPAFSLSQELGVEDDVFQFIDKSHLDPTSVAPLVQILQVGSVGVRMMLVDALSCIKGPEATRALVDRALFDVSQDVRLAATRNLVRRDPSEARPHLLQAFRYPLPAVAFHAAETLVALRDTDALPKLEELSDAPDPRAPHVAEDGTLQKTELVRVNHLRNCLLCHPRSGSRDDKVRGAIPTPGQPVSQSYGRSISDDAVRAEVTYLRQDFSVMQPVTDSDPWPEMQRFDFLVRTRPLTEEERNEHAKSLFGASSVYPQREAAVFAIKGLKAIKDSETHGF